MYVSVCVCVLSSKRHGLGAAGSYIKPNNGGECARVCVSSAQHEIHFYVGFMYAGIARVQTLAVV